MKSFKKLAALLALTAISSNTASGAPTQATADTDPADPAALQESTTTALSTPIKGTVVPSGPTVLLRRVHGGSSSTISIPGSYHQKAGGLAALLGPLLALFQPLLNGVNSGVQSGAGDIGSGIHQVGSALKNTVSGVGTITANTASGLGGTVKGVPAAIYQTTEKLHQSTGADSNSDSDSDSE